MSEDGDALNNRVSAEFSAYMARMLKAYEGMDEEEREDLYL